MKRQTIAKAATLLALLASNDVTGQGRIGSKKPKKPKKPDPLQLYRSASDQGIARLLAMLEKQERRLSTELGMAILAIAGSGSSLDRGAHSEALQDLVKQLRVRQWQDGSFYDAAAKGPRVTARVQAMATLGLLECAATSRDADCRDAAARAASRVAAAVREDGSVSSGYSQDDAADFDAAIWSALVLGQARRARIGEVDDELPGRVCAWLRSQIDDDTISDDFEPRPHRRFRMSGRARAAATLLAHRFAGIDPGDHQELRPLPEQLVPLHRSPQQPAKKHEWADPAAFFMVAMALYQHGGAPWKAFQPHLERAARRAEGGKPLERGATGQALRTSAIQAYWRYGPLLRRR